MYKVTLSMPVYNSEKYIERALLSALNQTFEHIEYLIIDDKGSDSSMDIVRRIIAEHPRGKDVRIIDHEVNKGTGATKNSAIDNAQGEYLYFMDSDDEIMPNCISILYEKMMETPVDFVTGSITRISIDEKADPLRGNFHYSDELIRGSKYAVAEAFYLNNTDIFVATWNKLYSIDFLRKNNIRCIPHHLSEDQFFTFQVILTAQSCRLASNMTYFYYETDTSFSITHNRNLSAKQMNAVGEIYLLEQAYAQNYRNCNFYSQLILQLYLFAIGYSIMIARSTNITTKDKRRNVLQLLKYPLSYSEILQLNEQRAYHLLFFFVSKIQIVWLSLFLERVLGRIYRFLYNKK